MPEERFDYTKAVAELEAIVAKIEEPGTGFDDIPSLVSRAKTLIQECRDYLRTVRESIMEEEASR